jgi:hypothetical protein
MTTSQPKRASYKGRVLVPLVDTNPRKPGTMGYDAWEKIRFGMTYEEYCTAGGARVHLDWDRARGWIKFADETPLLLTAGPAVVTEAEPVQTCAEPVAPATLTKAERKALRKAAA